MSSNPIQPGGNKSPRDVDRLASKTRSLWSRTYVFIKKANVKTWKQVFILAFIAGAIAASVWMIALKVQTITRSAGTLPSAPLAHWKLDETSGLVAADSSGNKYNGKLINGPAWSAGRINGSLNFDGANDYVAIPNSANLENVQENNYSLSAWFMPDTLPRGTGSAYNTDYGIIMKKGQHAGLRYSGSGRFAMDNWLSNGAHVGADSAGTFPPGSWYHLVGVVDRDAGTTKIYVNGVLKGTRTFAAGAALKEYSTMPWRIGAANSCTTCAYGNPADGKIDEVFIYNRALSASEVLTLFGGTTAPTPLPAPTPQSCGDNSCNNNETCSTCPGDCGACPPNTTVYLSDLTWNSATSGWGPVEKDQSNGEKAANDGRTLTLNGQTYQKGLGAHATSDIRYSLNGQYAKFSANVGVDDEMGSKGSVIFQVYADSVKVYDSGKMTGDTATKTLNVDITGKKVLRLLVTNAGDGDTSDHADWANAMLVKGTTPVQSCGDKSCNNGETCSTCPGDCGACPTPTSTPTPTPSPTLSCNTVNTNSFFGCYYNNPDLTNLLSTRTDSAINFDWGSGSPASSIGADTFSARWQGNFTFESSNYTFTATADDGIRVYVDGALVINKWLNQSATTYTAVKAMTAGTHLIKVEYYDNTYSAVAQVSWAKGTISSTPPPIITPPPAGDGTFKVVGYFGRWDNNESSVNYDYLTHVNYSFLMPNFDGSLKSVDEAKLSRIVSLAHAKGTKVLIAIVGGWISDADLAGLHTMLASPTYRANFISNIISFMNSRNLDGLDVDIEFYDSNFSTFIKELAPAVHNSGKLLTAATWGLSNGPISKALIPYFDFLNLMSYIEINGMTYSTAQKTIEFWQGQGLPKSKMILGVPFYGKGAGEIGYDIIVSQNPQAPYATNGDGTERALVNGNYFTYNAIQTIKNKTALAAGSAGGVMIWSIGSDTFDGTSLLKAIHDAAPAY